MRHLTAALLLALALLGATPARADELSITQLHVTYALRDAAVRWGISERYLDCVAWAESGLTPWAVGAEGEQGVMQLAPATYAYYADALDRQKGEFNAWSNTNVAADLIAHGMSHLWGPRTISLCGYYMTPYGY